MPDKHNSITLPARETVFLSILLGLLIAWIIKDPLFPVLSGGTAFEIRSPIVKIAFLAVLVSLISLMLLAVFQKQLLWLLSHSYIAFFFLSVIPLAAHAYIGSFSRFVADDFSSATLAVNKGVLGATWDWYIHWSGRFSASFFDSLFGYLGPSSLRWETGIALLLLLAAMTTLTWQLLQVKPFSYRFSLAVFLPALILATSFNLTPDLPQSLYWGQGMRSLIFPLIPAAFLTSAICFLVHKPGRKNSLLWLASIGLVSFFAGGFGETYVVVQITLYGLAVVLAFFSKPIGFHKKIFPVLLVGLLCSLTAMAVTIAAPGNTIRQTYFQPTPDFANLLLISSRSLGTFMQSIVNSGNKILAVSVILLASACTGYLYANKAKSSPTGYPDHPFLHGFARALSAIIVLAAILLYACFVPAAYGMSTYPPDRTVIIPVFILCIFLSLLGMTLGFQIHNWIKDSMDITRTKSRLIFWLLFFLSAFYTFQISTNILSVGSDYQHFAAVFDRADGLIREAKSQGQISVKVPEVHNHFGLSDFGAGTTYWLDKAVEEYYGINVVVNKNMK